MVVMSGGGGVIEKMENMVLKVRTGVREVGVELL